jgi:hypothetical protein
LGRFAKTLKAITIAPHNYRSLTNQRPTELKMQINKSAIMSGTTTIGDEGIKKHFKSTESWQSIFELAWNGFDAKAENIKIVTADNQMGGTARVAVFDDGEGIDIGKIDDTFGKFNESAKGNDADQHGSNGRGRLAFHKLSQSAQWFTKTKDASFVIEISSESIKKYSYWKIPSKELPKNLIPLNTGTVVELINLTTNLPNTKDLLDKLSIEFGWHLALHKTKKLSLNGQIICVPSNEITEKKLAIENHTFEIKIIRWIDRPSSEKSFMYLLNSAGKIVYKKLSTLNNKTGFFSSVYVQSSWADSFEENSDLISTSTHTTNSNHWKKLEKELALIADSVYEKFLVERAAAEIEQYEKDGLFPSHVALNIEDRKWRINYTKGIVKSIYIADPAIFSSTTKKQKKIIIRLLDRLAFSNQNDAIFEVLNSVLDLDDVSMQLLQKQIERSSLENIISTIEVLQRRGLAAERLRELLNSHHTLVRETPDLQQIIENNTWLFGAQYETLGAEEDSFTKIAKTLRNSIKDIDATEVDDLDNPEEIDGAKRQVDLFLARKMPTFDNFGRQINQCTIIEIKRPSVALNVKHLHQLDAYAAIIKKYPEFTSEKMHFKLILVGRSISSKDTEIASRLSQTKNGELGLVTDDGNIKRYVMNWYTLLDSFNLSNTYLLEKLKLKREQLSSFTSSELIGSLQAGSSSISA